jgi:NADPH2:quinone reductase
MHDNSNVRASVLHTFGPPSVLSLEDVAEPAVQPGQVKIEVAVANITFVDTQIRAGKAPSPAMLPTLPAILGNGVGGTVAEVGEGVETALLGTRAMASLNGTGGYAEYAVVDAGGLIGLSGTVPAITMQDAVALLADGRTAMLLVETADIHNGDTVLVEAAAGGVGSLLVQRARNTGAFVVAAVGGSRKAAVARDLGAHRVIDYTDPAWKSRLSDTRIDVVFDGVGGDVGRAAFDLLRADGRFCAFGMASGAFAPITEAQAASRGIKLIRGARATSDQLRELARAAVDDAVAGRWRPLVGQTFSLERAADAHVAIEERATVGKTLLLVAASSARRSRATKPSADP